MAFDRFLIAPFNSGLQQNMKPWLIPEDAFAFLYNMYVFRGRVRKRFGGILTGFGWSSLLQAQLFSRLRVQVGTIGAPLSPVPGSIFKVGQLFSAGDQIFTVFNPNPGPQAMLHTGIGTGTFDLATGAFALAGTGLAAGTPIYFYPADPVMGIYIYQAGVYNNQPTYAWDTQFAYLYTGGQWQRSGTGVTPIWHGTDLNFFWVFNWQGGTNSTASPSTMFVTNYFVTNPNGIKLATDDPIWTFDGTTWVARIGANGFYFEPNGGAPQTGPYVQTARIIVAFKNRLLLLNTIENDNVITGPAPLGTNTQYVNRLRYSAYASPFQQNAWYEPDQSDNSGNPQLGVAIGADFIDATTEEEIISAEFIKDRLIVFFSQSTWEIVYTGNQVAPFAWQKLNTELGSQAEKSTVPFDQFILTMSNIGVHSCNGQNVVRIDEKIPDEVFEIRDKELGIERIAGIRDFFVECVYWSFPSDDITPVEKFPNRVLLYNYKNDSWALNEDCITSFGYLQQSSDETWADQSDIWDDADFTWTSGINQAQFRQILAGNQEGFIFQVDPQLARNAPAMQLTNATSVGNVITLTIVDHTLQVGEFSDYIMIENAVVSLGTTDGAGNASGTVPGSIGNYFIIGSQTYLIVAPSNVLQTTGPGSGTFDKLTGAYTFTGAAPASTIFFVGDGLNEIFKVQSIVNANTITVYGSFTGTYAGGGTVTRVSNPQILSKEWNPYVNEGRNVYLARIDFGVLKTGEFGSGGAVTVDYYPSSTELSMIQAGQANNCIVGDGTLETTPYDPAIYPLESVQARLWHPIYFQTTGESVQIFIYMSDAQMTDPVKALADFEIEGMVLHTSRSSSRLQ